MKPTAIDTTPGAWEQFWNRQIPEQHWQDFLASSPSSLFLHLEYLRAEIADGTKPRNVAYLGDRINQLIDAITYGKAEDYADWMAKSKLLETMVDSLEARSLAKQIAEALDRGLVPPDSLPKTN